MHGTNVTSFIDVMLVLLIIFMVAAPLATVRPAILHCRAAAEAGQAHLSHAQTGRPVARDQLASVLDSATGGNKDDRIFLRADRSVPYGDVMAVTSCARRAI